MSSPGVVREDLKTGCAALKEPTHGERLCGVAVANTVAAPTADATMEPSDDSRFQLSDLQWKTSGTRDRHKSSPLYSMPEFLGHGTMS